MTSKTEDPAALTEAIGRIKRPIELIPQIETALGLESVERILAVPGVRRAAFGHLDFAVDIGAAREWEAMLFARSTIVLKSRLAGRATPIDSVTPDFRHCCPV